MFITRVPHFDGVFAKDPFRNRCHVDLRIERPRGSPKKVQRNNIKPQSPTSFSSQPQLIVIAPVQLESTEAHKHGDARRDSRRRGCAHPVSRTGTARYAISAVLCWSLVCLLLRDTLYRKLLRTHFTKCWVRMVGGGGWRCSGPRTEQLFVKARKARSDCSPTGGQFNSDQWGGV